MAYYSDEFIESVRESSDIVDVISQYVNLQKKGSTYFGLCPFHNEKTGSFSVTPGKQMYYCFGCHKGGNAITFIQEYENMTFPEAIEHLAERAGIPLPENTGGQGRSSDFDKREKLLEINKEAAGYFYKLLRSDRGKRALDYFTKRELTPETMTKFGLGYSDAKADDLYQYLKAKGYSDEELRDSGLCLMDEKRGGHDKFWNRAMFPILNDRGKVIAFGGRVMGEGEPKYLNSPETMIFPKRKTLYAMNIARSTRKPYFILCEGYMDVISLHQAGFDNAVAGLGTALTEENCINFKKLGKDVYLSYDSDGAGQDAAKRAIKLLKDVGIKTKVINMAPHKDPDEFIKALGADEYQKRIDAAENSFMFLIRMRLPEFDMTDPGGKADFFKAALRMVVEEYSSTIERDAYVEAISLAYGVATVDLKQMMRELGLDQVMAKSEMPEQVNKPRMSAKSRHEDVIAKSQRVLLNWISDDVKYYRAIKPYIELEDFADGIYRQVAQMLFEQCEEGNVNAPAILAKFQQSEEVDQVAGIFNTTVGEVDNTDMGKALKETIIKLKQYRLEQLKNGGAMADQIKARQNLQKLQLMSIKF